MNVFVVYAHPEQRSFNAALHEKAIGTLVAQGHEVIVSDLYRMDFEPVASRKDFLKAELMDRPRFRQEQAKAFKDGALVQDILEEQKKLRWCDLLILQFPLWWFSMPAILKGWFDRVLTPGFAYSRSEYFNLGCLRGRKALILLTTGSGKNKFTRRGINGPMDVILFPIQYGTLYYVGFDVLPPFVAWQPSRLPEEQRLKILDDLSEYLGRLPSLAPIPFPKMEDADKHNQLGEDFAWSKFFHLFPEE